MATNQRSLEFLMVGYLLFPLSLSLSLSVAVVSTYTYLAGAVVPPMRRLTISAVIRVLSSRRLAF